jgi:protein SCO1/2
VKAGVKAIIPILVFLSTLLNIAAQTNHYAVRGVVQQIAPDHRHVTIQHEAIPGYMMAMTMDFSVRDTNAVSQLVPGDQIAFTLTVTADDDWVENLRRTGTVVAPELPAVRVNVTELQVGDELPPADFTGENGEPVHLADFRGRAVAFTFFFTRCPLPEFCPRMNQYFAEARKLLLADTNSPANWQLVSVSFDPESDQPENLRLYANLYRGGDTNRWLFAVATTNTLRELAPRLDFHYWRENGTLSHNLRTVVLDPHGRIAAQFDGNDWTPAQLAEALRDAAQR